MQVFTTGQVARICRVAPRTVSKWFDAGLIGGYRIPGGSNDRRILEPKLREFMTTHGMPIEWLDEAIHPRPLIAAGTVYQAGKAFAATG